MGYMVLYSTMRIVLRKQIFAEISTIPNTSLTTFTILKTGKPDVFTGRKMPELKVDGKLYDIVRQKDNGSSITYFCLRDHREEQLILKASLFTDRSKNRNPFTKTTRLILEHIIKTALLTEIIGSEESQASELIYEGICRIYVRPVLPVPAPPPQLFS
jgi:hypothetical protein